MRDQIDNVRACEYFKKDLAIGEKLSHAEPDRSDLAGDLAVSHSNLGNLMRAESDIPRAREYFEKDLAISKRLAEAEPDRADLASDLAVSYSNLSILMRALRDIVRHCAREGIFRKGASDRCSTHRGGPLPRISAHGAVGLMGRRGGPQSRVSTERAVGLDRHRVTAWQDVRPISEGR